MKNQKKIPHKNPRYNHREPWGKRERRRKSLKNEDFLREYLNSLRFRRAPSTVASKKNCLKRYLKFINKPLGEVDSGDIRRFVDTLAEENLREKTIHNYICFIRIFFRYLNRRYGLDIPDFDDICASDYRGKIPSKFERQPLTREEVRVLIQAARSIRDKLIIAALYYTGLRVSELANLKLEDID